MKQEKHEIRCSEIEKRLGKCCFFEKSYKNARTIMPEGCRVLRHPFEIGQNSTRLITVRNAFRVILIITHIYLMSV